MFIIYATENGKNSLSKTRAPAMPKHPASDIQLGSLIQSHRNQPLPLDTDNTDPAVGQPHTPPLAKYKNYA